MFGQGFTCEIYTALAFLQYFYPESAGGVQPYCGSQPPPKLKRVEDNQLNISPNPFNQVFNVSFYRPLDREVQMNLFNVQGDLIRSKKMITGIKVYTINTENLKPGMYLVEITGYTSHKIIKVQ